MDFLQGINNRTIMEAWHHLIKHSLKKADHTIVERIESEQNHIIKSSKELGAYAWFVIECYELPEKHYAVMLEEGHVTNYVLLKHDPTDDRFISIFESNLEGNAC